jgi:hypothetical protein
VKLTGFGLAVLAASEGGYTPEVMRTNNIEPTVREKPAKAESADYAARREQSARAKAKRAQEKLEQIPGSGRGDTAEINIPWSPSKSKRLDATITREVQRQELEVQVKHNEARAAYWASRKAS